MCLSPQSTMRAWWRLCRYAKHSKCDVCVHKKNEKLSACSASCQTIPLFFPLSAVCWSWSAGPPISKWSRTSKNTFQNGCTSPTTIALREGTSTWRRDGRLHCKLVAFVLRMCQQAKERVAVAAWENNKSFGQKGCWLVVLLVDWKGKELVISSLNHKRFGWGKVKSVQETLKLWSLFYSGLDVKHSQLDRFAVQTLWSLFI